MQSVQIKYLLFFQQYSLELVVHFGTCTLWYALLNLQQKVPPQLA